MRRMQDSVAASASIEANLPRLEAISLSIPGSQLRVQTTGFFVCCSGYISIKTGRPRLSVVRISSAANSAYSNQILAR